jgi:hypothetical protein
VTAKKTKVVKFAICFKNPDLPEAMCKFGEFGEYYEATCEVNTQTGAGTIKFRKLGSDDV